MLKHFNCPVKLLHNVDKLQFILIGLEVHPLLSVCLSASSNGGGKRSSSIAIDSAPKNFRNKFNSYSSNTKTANFN